MRWPRPFPLFFLLTTILLALFLRTHQIEQYSFWIDEGLTPLRAGYSVAAILTNEIPIEEAVTRDTHPPFYYLLVHALQPPLGSSDFAYRVLSAFAGMLLVPLLFQFGRRLLGLRAGLAAALLTAVNPLQVWYGQEARMYTLLTLLGALAAYHLWRSLALADRGGPARALAAHGAAYTFWSALAVYTHYTALILFAAQALFWLWLLWRAGYRRAILATAAVGLLVVLPLLPATVPRLFTGAEANFYYVSPLIMLQDVVRGFALGVSVMQNGVTAFFMLFNALLLGLGAWTLWRASRAGKVAALFLITYLLATVAGLALGSLVKPLYQGVRHIMIGSPAYILLAVAGLRGIATQPRPVARAGLLLAGGLALLGPLRSLDAMYNDNRFAKDDMRSLVAYVEEHAGTDDVVVYSDAILMVLHRHYQRRPDLPVTTAPVYPHPFDGRTLDELATLAAEYRRIWFVPTLAAEPPERDPDAAVLAWLRANADGIGRRNFDARNSALGVEVYATGPTQFAQLPSTAQAVEPGETGVVGWRLDEPGAVRGPALWLDLFWPGGSPPEDLQLRFTLTDAAGWPWLEDNRPLRPDGAAWPANGLRRLAYGLVLPPALPPGAYRLHVQAWDAATGQPTGEGQILGTLTTAAADRWLLPPELPEPAFHFAGDLWLAVPALEGVELRPGHSLPIDLIWQAPARPEGLTLVVEAVAPDGRIVDEWRRAPGPDWLSAWPANTPVRDYAAVDIPPDAPTGAYTLRGRLLREDAPVPARVNGRSLPAGAVTLGRLTVAPWPLVTTLPPVAHPVEATFAVAPSPGAPPFVQLHGYDLDQAGSQLLVTLVWQVLNPQPDNYFVFVHLVDASTGEIAAQVDWVPVTGLRPTGGWRRDEVLVDPYTLPLAGVAPGRYELYVGFFAPDDGRRLPVTRDAVVQPDGRLLVTPVEIAGE